MGIVLKQSFANTLTLFMGFGIGGINMLFLYTHFLSEDYFGLVTFLLASATLVLPLVMVGMQHAVIKYFPVYKDLRSEQTFLTASLWIPLLVILPVAVLAAVFYGQLSNYLARENFLIREYTYLIGIIAFFMGYFEVFYAWAKIRLQSVFGNVIKEVFARFCTLLLLFGVYFNWLTEPQFIYAVVVVYGLRMCLMLGYAFYLFRPRLIFQCPENIREILSFSLYSIIAGSAAGILLEIDKFMISQLSALREVAYYAVGVYIASIIAIPARAMQSITSPITSRELAREDLGAVGKLYRQSSLNLLVVGGLLFLLINLNIEDLYAFIDKPSFSKGVWVVLIISLAKLVDLSLGIANAILTHSAYYRIIFYLSVAMALTVILLNRWLIVRMGIDGAALATFLVLVGYSGLKVYYVKKKFKQQPFGVGTLKTIGIILFLYGAFSIWEPSFHPVVNMILKSVVLVLSYLYLIRKLAVSEEVDALFDKVFDKGKGLVK
ncbi:MAG: oligosaccharide flippase family protein [Lutibacter sp.]|nr:oligosaccharide flippase family protein [Lutibacter sp.]